MPHHVRMLHLLQAQIRPQTMAIQVIRVLRDLIQTSRTQTRLARYPVHALGRSC
jgi:hypothetical protein